MTQHGMGSLGAENDESVNWIKLWALSDGGECVATLRGTSGLKGLASFAEDAPAPEEGCAPIASLPDEDVPLSVLLPIELEDLHALSTIILAHEE